MTVPFDTLMKDLEGYSVVGRPRCEKLYEWAYRASSLSGDVAEVGVYKGGTGRLIAKVFDETGKTVHLFDTFDGMPEVDASKDFHKRGNFGDTSYESVSEYFSDCKNVRIYEGLFPITAMLVEKKSFCFVHVDVDIYRSTLDCCEFFYPRMVKGGVMIFDDYGSPTCPGAKAAVNEFFSDKPERPIFLVGSQYIIIKGG